MGYKTIYLESAPFMHSAHTLYRSVGFLPSDSYAGREFEGAAHDVSVFMRLDLEEAPPSRPLRSRADKKSPTGPGPVGMGPTGD